MNNDIYKYDELSRELLKHEDNLVNNRLTWIWTLQGLLFASYGLGFKESINYFLILIAIVGIVVSASIGYNLHCSHRAIHNIHKYWNTIVKPKLPNDYPLLVGLTPKESKLDFLLPWRCLPTFLLTIWILLLIIALKKYGELNAIIHSIVNFLNIFN